MKKHAILCIDDEIDNVEALERLFRKKYTVLKATSGDEGLAILKDNPVALIISDQRMPKMTGVEFLKSSIEIQPNAIRILLTGFTDIDSVIGAINAGQVYRYVTKPWDPVDLQNTVDKAIEKYELRFELKQKNQELASALSELQVLDEAKTQFMMLINHELKTPLTVLMSFSELLRETKLSGDQETYLDRMSKATLRLQKLIDDVLCLIESESGKLKVVPKKFKAGKLGEKLSQDLLERAQKRGQEISRDFDDLSVKADEGLVSGVLHRLLENAIKFGPEAKPIEIRARATDGGVLVSVTNEGKSFPQKTIERILRPFSIDEKAMNHTEGTGLGLNVCQALLKAQGSELQFSSEKNQVTVSFELPS